MKMKKIRNKNGRFSKGHLSINNSEGTFSEGNIPKNSFGVGHIPWNKGRKMPDKKGKGNHKWKGKDVGYNALHSWVARTLGLPDTCEHCGTSGLFGRKINWANISKKYKRIIKDWKRLCVKCHRIFDKKENAVQEKI